MPAWLLYSIAYLLIVGANGVITKWALKSVEWPTLVLSTTVAYGLIGGYAVARGMVRLPELSWPVLLAVGAVGVCMAGSFMAMVLALERGDASQVVPISAAYPIVTLLLAVLFLSEPITAARLTGVLLVVVGVILVAR